MTLADWASIFGSHHPSFQTLRVVIMAAVRPYIHFLVNTNRALLFWIDVKRALLVHVVILEVYDFFRLNLLWRSVA